MTTRPLRRTPATDFPWLSKRRDRDVLPVGIFRIGGSWRRESVDRRSAESGPRSDGGQPKDGSRRCVHSPFALRRWWRFHGLALLVDRRTQLLDIGAGAQPNTAGRFSGTQSAPPLPLANRLSRHAQEARGFRREDEVGWRSRYHAACFTLHAGLGALPSSSELDGTLGRRVRFGRRRGRFPGAHPVVNGRWFGRASLAEPSDRRENVERPGNEWRRAVPGLSYDVILAVSW